ncbi:hypothetical protein R6Q57_010447 [Mikania cordata]
MRCKHRCHLDCIVKWLEIHGFCLACRYELPMDGEEKQRKGGGAWCGWGGEEAERRWYDVACVDCSMEELD